MRTPFTTLVALALLTSACAGEDRGDSQAPNAQRSSAAATAVFRSPLLAYSLVLPDGWTAVSSSESEDYFESADQRSTLTIGTAIPEPGQTVDDRVRENRSHFAGCDTDPGRDRPIEIDTDRAILWDLQCAGRYRLAANTIHDGVGYRLMVEVPAGEEAQSAAIMDQLVESFAFTQ